VSGLFGTDIPFFVNGSSGGGGAGVSSFNGRTGAVTPTAADVVGAFAAGNTNGTLAITTTSVAGNEILEQWAISGDTASSFQLRNGSGIPSSFNSWLRALNGTVSATTALIIEGTAATDTGVAPLVEFRASLTPNATVNVRPLFAFTNNGTPKLTMNADGSTKLYETINLVKNSIAGAETLQTWSVSDDATANLAFKNGTSAAGAYLPSIVSTGSTTNIALAVLATGQTDTGVSPVCQFNAQIGAGVVATRPVFDFQNNGVSRLTINANGTVTSAGQVISNGGFNGQGPFSTLFNSTAIPTTSPGLAITSNHSGGGSEVNFWNANGSVSPGFDWFNLTSAGTVAQRLMYLNGLGTLNLLTGNLALNTAGTGIQVKEGSNARSGTVALVGGVVTVSNTSVSANTRIQLTSQADGGTPGFLRVSARTAGTNFIITSSNALDTSTVAYFLVEGI
jgi:hypothetical protein